MTYIVPREREDEEHSLHPPTAYLIGIYTNSADKEVAQEHVEELESLAETFGMVVLEKEAIYVREFNPRTCLSKGKLEDAEKKIEELDADFVIFDDEILPSQQRNLENLFNRTVMDRTELILEVFAQRAQTKEAQIQIELAKVKYQYPRLKRLWTHLERQAGGGLFLKGMGEKQIEVDKRLLRKRQAKLERELKEVENHRKTQRLSRQRTGIPTFAIIGYTNAGKSTLLNALTGAEVLMEDKLFATLDTTTRKFTLPDKQEVLLTDTVGFIRKIPHTLVAAFKSTLEESVKCDILLHLVDVSHPMAEEQADSTFEVLKELNAQERPIITLFNKVDKCETLRMVDRLRIKFPKTVQISAVEKTGFDELMKLMMEELSNRRCQVRLRIPQSDYAVVTSLRREAKILQQDYEDNDVLMFAEVPREMVNRLEPYIEASEVNS